MRTVVPKNATLIPKHAKQVFKGIIFDVYHWQQSMFDGTQETFERIKRLDTVRVFAIKDNKLVLLQERQPQRNDIFYSLPGGRHDQPAETELQAAQRELKEETGLTFKTWKLLHVEQPAEKIDYLIYTFVASDIQAQAKVAQSAGEQVTVQLCTYQEALQYADASGRLPKDILQKAGSFEGLLAMPEFIGKRAE